MTMSMSSYSTAESPRTSRSLAFALDENYLPPFTVAVSSLFPGSCSFRPEVYVLHETGGLKDASLEKTRHVLASKGLNPHFVNCDHVLPKNLPIRAGDHVSTATFYRLFLGILLPETVESVVYLDLDILACGSVDPLFELKLTHPIAAVDHHSADLSSHCHRDAKTSYFNAGVMIADLEAWRAEDKTSAFLKVLAEHKDRIQWWDQDVLNLAFKENWQRLPAGFNATTNVLLHGISDIRIVHFDGNEKPWHPYSYHPYKRRWLAEYRKVFGQNLDLRPTLRNRFGQIKRMADWNWKKLKKVPS